MNMQYMAQNTTMLFPRAYNSFSFAPDVDRGGFHAIRSVHKTECVATSDRWSQVAFRFV
jgi:hypothetical protein